MLGKGIWQRAAGRFYAAEPMKAFTPRAISSRMVHSVLSGKPIRRFQQSLLKAHGNAGRSLADSGPAKVLRALIVADFPWKAALAISHNRLNFFDGAAVFGRMLQVPIVPPEVT